MDEKHKEDLKQIEEFIVGNLYPKYQKGVEEHGGNIWEKSVPLFVTESRNEITDLAVYLYHLSKKCEQIKYIIDNWKKDGRIDDKMWQEFSQIYDGTVHSD